ncbi:hypothetical protein [Streptomyces canus]|uniref:hypothetical protein n=1 Tax=Streptomyces canus TaxID=58343 RepID=UPI002E275E36
MILRVPAEPGRQHLRVPVEDDRTVLDLTPCPPRDHARGGDPVVEEAPEWWDERRLLGTGPR